MPQNPMSQMMEEADENPAMEPGQAPNPGTQKSMPTNLPKISTAPKKPMKKRIRSIADLKAAANELGVKKQKMPKMGY